MAKQMHVGWCLIQQLCRWKCWRLFFWVHCVLYLHMQSHSRLLTDTGCSWCYARVSYMEVSICRAYVLIIGMAGWKPGSVETEKIWWIVLRPKKCQGYLAEKFGVSHERCDVIVLWTVTIHMCSYCGSLESVSDDAELHSHSIQQIKEYCDKLITVGSFITLMTFPKFLAPL